MTNNVTYTIELKPENAAKIDQINRILLGSDYTAEVKPEAPAKAATKSEAKTPAKSEAPAKSEITLDEVKKAAKKAKKDHGEDFANSVLDDHEVKEGASLGRRMSAIDEESYASIIAAWEAGPQVTEQSSDEPDEDDDFDDDDDGLDDESEVTAEAVKTALKAYAKEVGRDEAKEIMTKNGASALSKVDDCTPAQLKKMFTALT